MFHIYYLTAVRVIFLNADYSNTTECLFMKNFVTRIHSQVAKFKYTLPTCDCFVATERSGTSVSFRKQ